MKGTLYWKKHRPSDETLNRGPEPLWSLKIPKKKTLRKRVGVLPQHPDQTSPLASDHHGLLIIPIHWLTSSLCLLSTNKLVCGGRSGAIWLPSHYPGGCCTLVVDEEIAPLLCKALWVSRKALYKCNKLLLLSIDSVYKLNPFGNMFLTLFFSVLGIDLKCLIKPLLPLPLHIRRKAKCYRVI